MKAIVVVTSAALCTSALAQDSLILEAAPVVQFNETFDVKVFAQWGAPGIGFAGYEGKLTASQNATFSMIQNGQLDPNFAQLGGNNTSTLTAIVGQLPQIINPGFVTANPVLLFSAKLTPEPNFVGVIDLATITTQFAVYTGATGASRMGQPTEGTGSVFVFPTPTTATVVAAGLLVAARRRR